MKRRSMQGAISGSSRMALAMAVVSAWLMASRTAFGYGSFVWGVSESAGHDFCSEVPLSWCAVRAGRWVLAVDEMAGVAGSQGGKSLHV
jgi:hypothetical protein